MKYEYAIEIFDKATDNFVSQVDVKSTYEEAKNLIKNSNIDIDKNNEYLEIIQIEYDDEGNELGRVGLVAE